MTERIREISKETPLRVTIGLAVTVIVCVVGMAGVAYKAKHDVEAANVRQDAEIERLNDKIVDLKEVLDEVRIDVKTILRSKP
jgi:hypothetical protein